MLPGDDDKDPSIHVEETLSFNLVDFKLSDSKDELMKIPDWKIEGGLFVKLTLMVEDERDGTHHFLIGQIDE